MNIRLEEGEKILKEGKANKCGIFFSQGGTLYLTNKRISFIGHGFNVGKNAASVNNDEILTFGKAFTFLVNCPIPVPNAF